MGDLNASLAASSSGLRAQTNRMRIAAENVANASSTADTPGGDPYRRRVPVFEETLLRESGAKGVRVIGARDDPSDFRVELNPGHPAADAQGYVKLPNVDALVEVFDMREASRAYEANLNMIEAARNMGARALELLRR
jgi:flagellar basal-body rod protein FlgC